MASQYLKKNGHEVGVEALRFDTRQVAVTALEEARASWREEGRIKNPRVRVMEFHGTPQLVAWYKTDRGTVLEIGCHVHGWDGETLKRIWIRDNVPPPDVPDKPT